jgi:hypothetical protein
VTTKKLTAHAEKEYGKFSRLNRTIDVSGMGALMWCSEREEMPTSIGSLLAWSLSACKRALTGGGAYEKLKALGGVVYPKSYHG